MPSFCLALALGTIALPPAAPAREWADPAGDYAACMRLVDTDPKAAFNRAGELEVFGAGAPAAHCRAAALAALGEPAAAAELLEETAKTSRTSAEIKAGLLLQAARRWMDADQKLHALAVLDAALRVTPEAPDLLEERALVKAAIGELWSAVDDLNLVLDLAPNRVSALVLRAAAYRRLDTPELAEADVTKALALAPNNLDALLEQGNLARVAGRDAEARDAWMTVLRQAPESVAAGVARRNLARMDVSVE